MKIGHIWFEYPFINGENFLVRSMEDVKKADLLIFWGGEDINPEFYGEKNNKSYYYRKNPRDDWEQYIYETCADAIPMLGICRGAQLLCALGGGKLWQHVDNHNRTHNIKTADSRIIEVSSTHHQMMRPAEHMEVVATSEHVMSPSKWNQNGEFKDNSEEAEILYDPRANALMVQGHPEYSGYGQFKQYVLEITKKYLGV